MDLVTRHPQLLTILVLSLAAAGCTTSYVDPGLRKVSYADLKPGADLRPVQLTFEFQTNGAWNAGATRAVRSKVKQILETSEVFASVNASVAGQADELDITMNNVGDLGEAYRKGYFTGLTFGLVGSMVTDGYVFSATYRPAGSGEGVGSGCTGAGSAAGSFGAVTGPWSFFAITKTSL